MWRMRNTRNTARINNYNEKPITLKDTKALNVGEVRDSTSIINS